MQGTHSQEGELPLLCAAALVTETGNILDHVAAQARERGLPAVVAVAGACALLAKNPRPADADIDAAMSGNICRCGTYNHIRAAIHDAAATLRKG